MWTKSDYENFEKGLNALLESAKDIGDDELVIMLVDYLDGHCAIERDYATEDFRHCLAAKGRDAIGKHVLSWAEECISGIRWPAAYTYVVTGKLAVDYQQNTTVVVVVVDREEKVLGHRVIHWADFSQIEDDKECGTSFYRAIDDGAIELGARSIFRFHCDGQLTKSVSVFHDPEQGFTLFDERGYGSSEKEIPPSTANASQCVDDGQEIDEDFMQMLEDL